MTLSWMRKDFWEEILPLEKSTSDLNVSESTVGIVERTYKEMEDFEEKIEPKYTKSSWIFAPMRF